MRSPSRNLMLLFSHVWNLSALCEPPRLPDPFSDITVTAGASPAAAARTLQELRRILADKVANGELTDDDAQRILQDAYGRLSPLASSAAALGTVSATATAAHPASSASASRTTVIVIQSPAPAGSAPAIAPAASVTMTDPDHGGPAATASPGAVSPLPTAGGAKNELAPSSAQAFDELQGLLSHRKAGRSAEPLHRPSAGGAEIAGAEPKQPFAFSPPAFGGESGIIVSRDTQPARAIASLPRRSPSPRPLFAPGARTTSRGTTAGTGLLAVPRLRWPVDGSAGPIARVTEDGDSALPAGVHWIFASTLLGLLGRAAYQWRRDA